MKTKEKLDQYYEAHPFLGESGGLNEKSFTDYLGKFDIQVPNFNFRKKLVPYHDLNHIVSGYNNSRAGEGEVSAWELGTGTLTKPLFAFYSFAGFTTGLLVDPKRTYAAFRKGRLCRNLYDFDLDELLEMPFSEVEKYSFLGKQASSQLMDNMLFFIYSLMASPFAVGYHVLYGITRLKKNAVEEQKVG